MKELEELLISLKKSLDKKSVSLIIKKYNNNEKLDESLFKDADDIFSIMFLEPSSFKEIDKATFRSFRDYCLKEIKRIRAEKKKADNNKRRKVFPSRILKERSTVEVGMSPLVEKGFVYDAASY